MSGEIKKATIKAAGDSVTGRHRGYRLQLVPVFHPSDDDRVCAGLVRTVRIELYLSDGDYDPAGTRDAVDRLVRRQVQLSVSGKTIKGFVRNAVWTQHADANGAYTSATAEFEIYSEERFEAP